MWVWSSHCDRPTSIAIRVRLDERVIYTDSIPVCRAARGLADGHLSFRFTSPRSVVWFGYRSGSDSGQDKGDTTAAKTPFEVDLWQAGGEAEGIELGFSASAPDGLHMNTIHLLSPTKRSETTMAAGLLLETRPIGRLARSKRAGS